jgi:ferredoxin
MTLEVTTDRDLCIGSENCVRYAPHTFETDAEGKVTVRKGSTDTDAAIRTAVQGCPVGALSIPPGEPNSS